jgi:hypothetical protein
MTIPAFTAETSLYKTSGHYRTGRYNLSAETIRPAAEVIEIHDCAPGFLKLGEWPNMTCIPDPNDTGGDGEGPGPGDGLPTGGGNSGPKPHSCTETDIGSLDAVADALSACRIKRGNNAYLWCVPRGHGRTTAHCCVRSATGQTSCVPLSALSGTTAVSHGSLF